MFLTGFTLIELLIVIAVIIILSGIVVPRLDTGLKIQNLKSDTKKLASNIALAQNYAVAQTNDYPSYGVSFYDNGYSDKGYRIIPYDINSNPNPAVTVPSSVNIQGDIPFSNGVSVLGPDIIFNSKGSILSGNDIQIVLSSGSSTRTITITHLTGHITIE